MVSYMIGVGILNRKPSWTMETTCVKETHNIAHYVKSAVPDPYITIDILLREPELQFDSAFTVVHGTDINWPTAMNGPNHTVSLPILMFYILFTAPDCLPKLSFAWDKRKSLLEYHACGAPWTAAHTSFVYTVTPWLEAPVLNSIHVDSALRCGRHDMQFVISIGNQRIKAILGDTANASIDACVQQTWHMHQTQPFFDCLQQALKQAAVHMVPVTLVPTSPKASYVLDNSVALETTDRDKTILLFLILFAKSIDFVSKWEQHDTAWRNTCGIPCQAVKTLIETLVARNIVIPPYLAIV